VSVAPGDPVLFDTVVSPLAGFISYNGLTGTITITQSGVYYLNWLVSTDGIEGGTDLVLTFAIVTSQPNTIKASSPIVTGEISGNALISIVASIGFPVTLQLINATNGTIGYGATPIKADLTIVCVTL
jgi:hypothetical protein